MSRKEKGGDPIMKGILMITAGAAALAGLVTAAICLARRLDRGF